MSPGYFRLLAVFRLYSLVLLGQPAVDTPGTEKETTSGVTWTAAGLEVEFFLLWVQCAFEDHTYHTVEMYEGLLNIYPP